MNDIKNDQPGNQYWPYRILGIIDNFIAVLFLFLVLINFAASGFQPSLLLYVFISLAVLIYTNLSAVFARHVMVRKNLLRPKLKDWIKVNAIVTILYACITLAMLIWLMMNGTQIQNVIDNYSKEVPAEMMKNAIHGAIYFFIVCMCLLIIHVIMTFRYLKQYKDHFRNEVES
jgi:hypothetical protein